GNSARCNSILAVLVILTILTTSQITLSTNNNLGNAIIEMSNADLRLFNHPLILAYMFNKR
ncbi:MAG: hypothetical protein QMA97_03145, partial [Glaciecola sp.]